VWAGGYALSSHIPSSSQLQGSPGVLRSYSSRPKSYFVLETYYREAEWKLHLTLYASVRWNYEKLTRSWKRYVLGLDSRQSTYSSSCRLAQPGRTTSGYPRACRRPHRCRPWAPAGVAGVPAEGSGHRGVKEASSPAAPISLLAKASKMVLAGSIPGGADAPSPCRAGRQGSRPGVHSDGHWDAESLCSREMAWAGGRGVCYYLEHVAHHLVLFWMHGWINKYVCICDAGILPHQWNETCCDTLEAFPPELIFWKYFRDVPSTINP